jgi:hypothetical protein
MKLKEIDKVLNQLKILQYDNNKNQKPEVVDCIIILERERLLRLQQARNMRNNFEFKSTNEGW